MTENLESAIGELRKAGIVLPKNPARALQAAREIRNSPNDMRELAKELPFRKTAHSSDISLAIPRFYDPLEYWDFSGLPWNMADEGHRHKLHKWARLFYATHYLVPALIDIYSRFPLAGCRISHHDQEIEDFYSKLFLDDLNYESFLVSVGREFWLSGECFPLAEFDENLGVWSSETLLNPEDVVIENFPLLGTRQLKLVPPDYMRRLAQTRTPAKEYAQLQQQFPNLIEYLLRNEPFPVDETLLKQIAFKQTEWDDHGTPILLRGLRTLIHEEKLLASQDAIAERLYSPMILAKLGYPPTQQNMGWLPGPDQLDAFRDDLDIALANDFRVLVHHYALEMENVFGREQVPDLGGDFDRVERRLCQLFGINPELLQGGTSSAPYASSALHAELMNQMLRTYQHQLKRHFQSRCEVVAEANRHYEYEKVGSTRKIILERVVEYDLEGNMHVRERPKLAVPQLILPTNDLRDEATERQFLMNLRQMGVPISDRQLMVGVNFTWEDSLDEMCDEIMQKDVAQQLTKLRTYQQEKHQGLPIRPNLKAEVEANDHAPAQQGGPGGPPGGGMPGGPLGGPPPGGGGMGEGIVMPEAPDLGPSPENAVPGGGPPPVAPIEGPAGAVPEISSERRPGMPAMSSHQIERKLEEFGKLAAELRERKRIREASQNGRRVVSRMEDETAIIEVGFMPVHANDTDVPLDVDFEITP